MGILLIKGATVVNEGKSEIMDVLIESGKIKEVGQNLQTEGRVDTIDARGLHLLPGLIDDQVHFREPGLTHKADLTTESRAAVAGGITSFMEMPNTVPNTLTQELLQEKYDRAAEVSPANFSFFMGASNDNIKEVLKTDPRKVCGVKVFMGSSTGNMLVDHEEVLEGIFRESPTLVATHCEYEPIIQENTQAYLKKYGDDVPMSAHPLIRSAEACYRSSSFAVELASKFNTQLHILHISTARETSLFEPHKPIEEKRITAEACIHHLWFTEEAYKRKGSLIKWNPAVKTEGDREAIRAAVNEGRIDVIATDHAPHTMEEKSRSYFQAPSGGPLVQHSLLALIDLYKQGVFSLEKIVEKSSHNVARLFRIEKRGFIRKGYWADLVLVDLSAGTLVTRDSLYYKCQWSPFEGHNFSSRIKYTLVNGEVAYKDGKVMDEVRGKRLLFNR